MQTESRKSNKPKFDLSLLPDAFLGIFGIRTEHEMEHTVLVQEGRFSLRFYSAHTELVAPEKGTQKRAVDKAFDSLFSYIEGENAEHKKFDMTTPVLSRKHGDHKWDVSFYMEEEVGNLPRPQGRGLSLQEIPSQTLAVIRFTGNITELSIKNMTFELEQFIKRKGLKINGKPVIAQYDQPFAIPFLKRNEILIPIKWDNAWSTIH